MIHGRMSDRLALALVALVAVFLHLPSLSFDRTFDDISQIRDPGETETRPFRVNWTEPWWDKEAHGGLYRPVTSSTNWVEARLALPLWTRHLTNVLLHALTCALVVRVALALAFPVSAALASGFLFALHPTHVEVVAGLVGRAELLAALWVLLAILWHDRRLREPEPADRPRRLGRGIPWLCGSAALAFLAAGSKESAWALPALVLPLHALRRRGLGMAWPAFAGYALGLGTHFALRHQVLGGWILAPGIVVHPIDNPLVLLHGRERWEAGLRVAGTFLAHLAVPLRLSPDYSAGSIPIAGSLLSPRFLAGLFLLLGTPVLAVIGWRSRSGAGGRAWFLAGTWLWISALLTMNVFLTLGTILADRLLFWPTVAWSLLLGGAVAGVRRPAVPWKMRIPEAAPWFALVVLLGLQAFRVVSYLPVWKNEATLFDYARVAAPRSPRAWWGYAGTLSDQNRFEEALEAYRRAQRLYPDYPLAWTEEAALFVSAGRVAEAKPALQEALRISPGDLDARAIQGQVWLEEGRAEDAIAQFRKILEEDPAHLHASLNLTHAWMRAEDPRAAFDKVLAILRRAQRAAPNSAVAWTEEAALFVSADREREATPALREALRLSPGNQDARAFEGLVWLEEGRTEDAIARFLEILNKNPTHSMAPVYLTQAWTRAKDSRAAFDEVLAALRQAQHAAPNSPLAWTEEAALFVSAGREPEAEPALREALRLSPGDLDARTFEGVVWLKEGRAEDAIARFREILEKNPALGAAAVCLAGALVDQDSASEAAAVLRDYLEIVPNDVEALNNLAWILATLLDQAALAEPLARRAVELRPERANLRDTLAETLARQGKHEEAAQVAREALRLGDAPAITEKLRRFLSSSAGDSSAARSVPPHP